MKGPLTGKLANELEAVKAYNPGVFELEIPFSRRKTTVVIFTNI
jgi:hypothetical protein